MFAAPIEVIIGTGNQSNRWSVVTIRLALAVYCRSPAAYSALKDSSLIQLPSRSTLQAYTGAFLDDAGNSIVYLLCSESCIFTMRLYPTT